MAGSSTRDPGRTLLHANTRHPGGQQMTDRGLPSIHIIGCLHLPFQLRQPDLDRENYFTKNQFASVI